MAYEQPNPITVPPSSMFTRLAPAPYPDYFSRSFVSDLPSRPSTHVVPPKSSKRGLYKNPMKSDVPGPPMPRQKALTKKLKRTGPKEKLITDDPRKIKIIRNGVVVKKSKKGKGDQKPRKRRKKN
jgi:hypothetical protein